MRYFSSYCAFSLGNIFGLEMDEGCFSTPGAGLGQTHWLAGVACRSFHGGLSETAISYYLVTNLNSYHFLAQCLWILFNLFFLWPRVSQEGVQRPISLGMLLEVLSSRFLPPLHMGYSELVALDSWFITDAIFTVDDFFLICFFGVRFECLELWAYSSRSLFRWLANARSISLVESVGTIVPEPVKILIWGKMGYDHKHT